MVLVWSNYHVKIITGDESWVQYFSSKSRPIKEWRQSSPPDVKNFKTSPPPGNVTCVLLTLLEKYLKHAEIHPSFFSKVSLKSVYIAGGQVYYIDSLREQEICGHTKHFLHITFRRFLSPQFPSPNGSYQKSLIWYWLLKVWACATRYESHKV